MGDSQGVCLGLLGQRHGVFGQWEWENGRSGWMISRNSSRRREEMHYGLMESKSGNLDWMGRLAGYVCYIVE